MFPDALITINGTELLDGYWLMICIGVIVAMIVFDRYLTKIKMPSGAQFYYLVLLILALALGLGAATLVQSIYFWIETGKFEAHGMTFLGGLIGGVIAFFLLYFIGNVITKGKYKSWLKVIVWVAPACVTIAHAFGRLGCFCAGCCYGIETDSFLGMHFTHLNGMDHLNTPDYRVHPTMLYEAAVLLLLFAVTSWLFFKKPKFAMPTYVLGYGIGRFLIEYLRNDERGEFLIKALSPSQNICLVMMIAGAIWLALVIVASIKKKGIVGADTDGMFEPIGKKTAQEPVEKTDEADVADPNVQTDVDITTDGNSCDLDKNTLEEH